MDKESKGQRVTPIAMDMTIERLPLETITREQYQRLGGVPVKEVEEAEVDPSNVMGGTIQEKKPHRSNPAAGSRVRTHIVED